MVLGRPGRALAAALAAVVPSALVVAASPALPATPTTTHVLVIGLDGARFDKIEEADAPHLHALVADGYASRTWLYAEPFAATSSGPGWATNLTGVWPDKHGVTSNSWDQTNLAEHPDFLTLVERERPTLRTYAAASWSPIVARSRRPPLIAPDVDTRYAGSDDQDTTDHVVTAISEQHPDAMFMQIDEIDHTGHAYGAASQEYLDAIAAADQRVGEVLAAIQARPADEQWTVLVTTDHGHTDAGGHGGSSPAERSSFIIKDGPGVQPSTPTVLPKNVDIAADVLTTLGLALPRGMDGRPLASVDHDPFEQVRPELTPQADETVAPGVIGWTHAVPSGWRIANRTLGGGGVTEWQGWTLTDDEFWTRVAPDQQRESNVRARGIFAVADSDEWSDLPHTGQLNTRLVSSTYDVRRSRRVRLSFGSHYLKARGEVARVEVRFDHQKPHTVLQLRHDDIAGIERLRVDVPRDAAAMRVVFSLTGGDNDWYWAVDNLRVR